MSDAQTWTTIGGMFTFMLAFMAVLVRLFGQNLDARFAALTAVMTAGFEQVERRLDRIENRVDALDRDVTAITRRLMDGPDTP